MSTPMADFNNRRPRRQFDPEFKAQAVRLVLDQGKSVRRAMLEEAEAMAGDMGPR